MGCYLSTPEDRVFVSEGKGKNFIYATASCQGWRREQEDAEECLPFFDENASLFILCDGHGGAEVAQYTVEHLPDFIKNHPLYKEGKYKEALKQAFIDFDATLRTGRVTAELHRLAFDDTTKKDPNKESKTLGINEEATDELEAGSSAGYGPSSSSAAGTSSSNNGSSTVVDDVDTETLRREAEVPIKELIEKYSTTKRLLPKFNASPIVKAKRDDDGGNDDENGEMSDTAATSKEDQAGPSSSKLGDQDPEQGPSSSATKALKETLIKQVLEHYFNDSGEDSSDDSEYSAGSSNDEDGDDEGDDDGGDSSSKKLRRKKHKRPTDDNLDTSSNDDDDDEDDDEEDEEDDEEEDDEEDDDEEDDQKDDVGDEEDDDNNWISVQDMIRPGSQRIHKPGTDSGCTVVVALIKDGKLYVANAGDSRCILITRNGECKPMSFDHKPEDAFETRRIMKAGGRVIEGRVNGGLNLSRALGDFAYKNPVLDAEDQMITPCPDVKTADFDPDEVEYLLLACDGIWNSMKNQQAANFIYKTAPTVNYNLIDICLNLFRTCIAPKTDGDGTGCDNMTCILAEFGDPKLGNLYNKDLYKKKLQGESDDLAATSHKRTTNEDESIREMPNNKRRCVRLELPKPE